MNAFTLLRGCLSANPADTTLVYSDEAVQVSKTFLPEITGSAPTLPGVDGRMKMRQGTMARYIPVLNATGSDQERPGPVITVAQTFSKSNNDISVLPLAQVQYTAVALLWLQEPGLRSFVGRKKLQEHLRYFLPAAIAGMGTI